MGEELFASVCHTIYDKYFGTSKKEVNTDELFKKIEKLGFVLHVYSDSPKYKEMIRANKFEHELRNLLLKYTLIIEENIKNIFTSSLNDKKANYTYLSDISNYKLTNSSVDTLRIILAMQKNKHSKPISRKINQKIIVPYWIIINELTLYETYRTIANLDNEMKYTIFSKCVNHFTELALETGIDAIKSGKLSNNDKIINRFENLIENLAKFRNMLAHNQPIYCYNADNCNFDYFPNVAYELPTFENLVQQHKSNAQAMINLETFFGKDDYNKRRTSVNLNLSYMIYVIYKIIKKIDKNTKFYEELIKIFKDYNIVITENSDATMKYGDYIELLAIVDELNSLSLNREELINKIENGEAYKQTMISFNKKFKDYKKGIKLVVNRINTEKSRSKYNVFTANKRYGDYTGIDLNFFKILK